MKEFDETKTLREKFETFKAQAPDFDSLFEGEVLGDAPLRQIYQSKLVNFEVKTPAFDELFAGQTLLKTAPVKRMFPVWIAVSVAAACTALMIMFPKKTIIEQQPISQVEHIEAKKTYFKSHKPQIEIKRDELLTQKIESPKTIQNLSIVHQDLKVREDLNSLDKEAQKEQTASNSDSKRMDPSKNSDLAVTYERSIEEAYAAAKAGKTRAKREKMTLGANLNSANKLLSLANSKTAGSFPLQGIASDYAAGYSSLKGSNSSILRSTTINRNDWVMPENISSDILKRYDAVYSLPVSLGFSVSIPLIRHFEIMTGLNYTRLTGNISGETSSLSFNLKQQLHYLGIPIKISVNVLKLGPFGAYATVGGAIEKGLAGVQESHVEKIDGDVSDWSNSQKVYGLQSSLTGQIGVYYELNKTFNIYFEPGVSYYTPSDQPISSRTEEPFNFNLGFGLRYRIN